jgi:hypothetical protein
MQTFSKKRKIGEVEQELIAAVVWATTMKYQYWLQHK